MGVFSGDYCSYMLCIMLQNIISWLIHNVFYITCVVHYRLKEDPLSQAQGLSTDLLCSNYMYLGVAIYMSLLICTIIVNSSIRICATRTHTHVNALKLVRTL